ncbi:Met-10+ like-protein-domain-containing protein [Xylariomycetidae sp. FL2044]|nr:Met-10+ like-protein-domain-containing protein [Xylariomycetidae sp. FL2044]
MAGSATDQEDMSSIFRPPVFRSAAGVLDRSLFSKTVNIAAAAVAENKTISRWRQELQKEKRLLHLDRIASVVPHPDQQLAAQGTRCLLLDPQVKPEVPDTWGAVLTEAVRKQELGIIPYDLTIDYDYWTHDDVMRSILPPDVREVQDGIPGGFNHAGHVAHMNLKEQFLPYKTLIAEVILDKNPGIRTVINKVANVGTESEFRTFAYEVLAGPDDLNVEARENDCVFRFDYSKVYWNSKLEGEHRRLVDLFQPGEVVCDVMAGIGPFAVPAGKKGVFVWANDYNPESYRHLGENIKRNKVSPFVRPFNRDGRVFIREAADAVYAASTNGEHAVIESSRRSKRRQPAKTAGSSPPPRPQEPRRVPIPPTISHFVMNLPASAITFLPHFRGLYAGREALFEAPSPHDAKAAPRSLPMVHVHCFAAKGEGDAPVRDVCARISAELGVEIRPGSGSSAETTPGVAEVLEVRNVAPNKRMFCASFRLPAEVAFAPRPS